MYEFFHTQNIKPKRIVVFRDAKKNEKKKWKKKIYWRCQDHSFSIEIMTKRYQNKLIKKYLSDD